METQIKKEYAFISKLSIRVSGNGFFSKKSRFVGIICPIGIKNFLNKNYFLKSATSIKAIISIVLLFIFDLTSAQNYSEVPGRYRVTAYQKENSQIISVSNEAELIPPAIFYIPNAFTPNGDGLNETFGLIGEGITEYQMQIFNRWGNLVFETIDLKVQWDGTYRNEKAPVDVYVYKITGKGQGGNAKVKKLINENGIVNLVL